MTQTNATQLPKPFTTILRLLTLTLIFSIIGKRTTTVVLASVFTLWFKTRFNLYQDYVEDRRTTRRERERQRRRQEARVISREILGFVLRDSGVLGKGDVIDGVKGEKLVNGDYGVEQLVNGDAGLEVVGVHVDVDDGDEVSLRAGEVEELDEGISLQDERWEERLDEEVNGGVSVEGEVGILVEGVQVEPVEEKEEEESSAEWVEDVTKDAEEKQVVLGEDKKEVDEAKEETTQWAEDDKQQTTSSEQAEKIISDEKTSSPEDTPKANEIQQQPEPEPEPQNEKPEPKPVQYKPTGLSQSRWSTPSSTTKRVLDPRATTFQPTEFKSSVKSQYQFTPPTTTRPPSSTPLTFSPIGVLASSSSSPLSAYSQPSIFSSVGRSTQSSTPSYEDYSQSPSYSHTYGSTPSYGNSPSYLNSPSYSNTSSYANTSPYGNTSSYGNSSYGCYAPSPYYSNSYNYASAN
ncbi:hypothetical protein BDV29DRAFT_152487 [Aspergillus leporis]|uniref:Uncharacterized protein n=1 Tax=Aspergillus leporis TaxID=41062 RepID=A0A5N5XIB6_9EURO|nr:hypothetical protein BDV29DRAFT_152487 [Aspergillus leporis]